MNVYLEEGIVRVCMNCRPGDSVFEAHPHLRDLGLKVSHGICHHHQQQMLAEIRAERDQANREAA